MQTVSASKLKGIELTSTENTQKTSKGVKEVPNARSILGMQSLAVLSAPTTTIASFIFGEGGKVFTVNEEGIAKGHPSLMAATIEHVTYMDIKNSRNEITIKEVFLGEDE